MKILSLFKFHILYSISDTTECANHCPQLFRPICASNGQTYNNLCQLEAENCKKPTASSPTSASKMSDVPFMLHEGPCQETLTPIIEAVEAEQENEESIQVLANELDP